MNLIARHIDYTDKDFDAIKARLIALLQTVFPEWSDFSVASFGNMLLEMYAFVGDIITFYADNQARESRLVTATQRKNVIALCRMLGYRLKGARAATAEVTFELRQIPSADVIIAAGTIVRTQEVTNAIKFQLMSDITILAGSDPPIGMGIVEHSKTHEQLFDSKGLANLDLRLKRAPYLDGTAHVRAANGEYVERENLLGSDPNDLHYSVLVDENDRALLRFGNGVSGMPPTGTIRVTYKTGGGIEGNVDAGRIAVIEGAFSDINGNPVQVSVTNAQPASGGARRQSIASAKLLAPESLRAMTRSVAREDFEINARRLPEVARALMLTSNEDTTIDENAGVLYVIARGGGMPTEALKAKVYEQVTKHYPCTLTFQVHVLDPVFLTIDILSRVYLKEDAQADEVRTQIIERLTDYFRVSLADGTPNKRVDFGFNFRDYDGNPAGEIAWSDIFNVIRDTKGVRKLGDGINGLLLNGSPSDVPLHVKEFPILGSITLINADTGGVL